MGHSGDGRPPQRRDGAGDEPAARRRIQRARSLQVRRIGLEQVVYVCPAARRRECGAPAWLFVIRGALVRGRRRDACVGFNDARGGRRLEYRGERALLLRGVDGEQHTSAARFRPGFRVVVQGQSEALVVERDCRAAPRGGRVRVREPPVVSGVPPGLGCSARIRQGVVRPHGAEGTHACEGRQQAATELLPRCALGVGRRVGGRQAIVQLRRRRVAVLFDVGVLRQAQHRGDRDAQSARARVESGARGKQRVPPPPLAPPAADQGVSRRRSGSPRRYVYARASERGGKAHRRARRDVALGAWRLARARDRSAAERAGV